MSEFFIKAEEVGSTAQGFRILRRFVNSLPLLKALFIPAILLNIAATILPQFFLWLNGAYSNCQSINDCRVQLPWLGKYLNLSPLLLVEVAGAAIVLRFIAWALFEISGEWSAQNIHRAMIKGVSNVRTVFFDENPSGRLINRMVRDYDKLRDLGVTRIGDTINAIIEVVCVAAVVLLAHPLAAILVVPTLVGFLYIQRQVAPMMQKAAGIRSIRLGEVLHRETDLVEGVRTFLLYGQERALFSRIKNTLVQFIQIHLLRAKIEAWGRFFTSTTASIYSFLVLVFIGIGIHQHSISLTLAGVIMTVVFRLGNSFEWLAWTTSYLVESVITARRVFDYVDLPDEIETERKEGVAPRGTKAGLELKGDIEFLDYSMSYRPDSPIILDHLKAKFPFGKRIGIVGRTGAGKSSIVQSLYRMVHVAGGDIRIGGTSIFDVDLETVRKHFTVVPQDPYLFEGTVRNSLDRERKAATAELEEALRRTGFNFPLDYQIQEGGKNLSVGERQLLCLARVLIANRPYIIMDEPTSGVDTITDAKIQQILATELTERTIITIAHRLDTLSQYDWIMELENGKLLREGIPEQMLGLISEDQVA